MSLTGQHLGHYSIGAKLGEGGMGVVYRAHDTRLGRDVAIKVLPDSVARDPERLARFEREAHTLAALNHPNIAAVYGVEQGALVMELVEGARTGHYVRGNSLVAAPVGAGEAHELFRLPALEALNTRYPYDVSPDGKRFLVAYPADADAAKSPAIHVVQNWPALLRGNGK